MLEMGQARPFDFLFFWGHRSLSNGPVSKSCLSQWYLAPFEINGVCYLTAEHYMMAEKARLFQATQIERQILAEKDPHKVKSLGRRIENYEERVWSQRRFDVVLRGNIAKFSQNRELKYFLEKTGEDILVEASPVDLVWGIGLGEDHPSALDPNKWRGRNLLGFALMQARTHIRNKL